MREHWAKTSDYFRSYGFADKFKVGMLNTTFAVADGVSAIGQHFIDVSNAMEKQAPKAASKLRSIGDAAMSVSSNIRNLSFVDYFTSLAGTAMEKFKSIGGSAGQMFTDISKANAANKAPDLASRITSKFPAVFAAVETMRYFTGKEFESIAASARKAYDKVALYAAASAARVSTAFATTMPGVVAGFVAMRTAIVAIFTSLTTAVAAAGSSGLIGKALLGAGLSKLRGAITAIGVALAFLSTGAKAATHDLGDIGVTSITQTMGAVVGAFLALPALTFALLAPTVGWRSALNSAKLVLAEQMKFLGAIRTLVFGIATGLWAWTAPLRRFATSIVMGGNLLGTLRKAILITVGIIAGGFVTIAATLGGSLWVSLKLIKAAMWSVGTSIVGMTKLVSISFASIRAAAAATWAYIIGLPAEAIALMVASAGILSIWLFGEGDGLISKLENFVDMVYEVFKPRPVQLADALKDAKIGDYTFEFKAKISALDTSKMSASEFKDFLGTSERVSEVLSQTKQLFDEQGHLTEEQLAQAQKAYNEWNRLYDRSYKIDKKSIDFSGVTEQLDKNTTTWQNKIQRWYDSTADILSGASKFTEFSQVKSFISGKSVDSQLGGRGISQNVSQLQQELLDVSKYLAENDIITVNNAKTQYQNALERYNDATGKFRTEENAKTVSKLEAEMIAAQKVFESAANRAIERGTASKAIADYKQELTDFTEYLKGSGGPSLKVSEVFFDRDDRDFATSLGMTWNQIRLDLEKTAADPVAFRLRVEQRGVENALKVFTDFRNEVALHTTEFEARIKMGGIKESKEDLEKFYVANKEGYEEFIRLTDEMSRKRVEEAKLGAHANRETRVAMIQSIAETQKKLDGLKINIAPVDFFSEFNDALQSMQLPSITLDGFVDLNSEMVALLTQASLVKKKIDEIKANKEGLSVDNMTASLREALKTAGLLKERIAEITRPTGSKAAAESLEGAGATQEKIRRLTPEMRDKMAPDIELAASIRRDLSVEGISKEKEHSLQASLDAIDARYKKIFEDPKKDKGGESLPKTIFDRFSDRMKKAQVDLKLEDFGMASDSVQKEAIVMVDKIEAIMTTLSKGKGIFPENSKMFRDSMEQMQALRNKLSGVMANIRFSDTATAVLEGTDIDVAQMLNTDGVYDKLLSIRAAMAKVVEQRVQIKVDKEGNLSSSDRDKVLGLENDERQLKLDRFMASKQATTGGKRMASMASTFSTDATQLAKFTTAQMDSLENLRQAVEIYDFQLENSALTSQEWLAVQAGRNAALEAANGILKSEIELLIERNNLDSIDNTSAIMMDVTAKEDLLRVLREINRTQEEYAALQLKINSGNATPADNARFKSLTNARKEPARISRRVTANTVGDFASTFSVSLKDAAAMSSQLRAGLVNNRLEIDRVQASIDSASLAELDTMGEVLAEQNKRLAIEQKVTSEIARRNEMADQFQGSFKTMFESIAKGEQTSFKTFFQSVSDTIIGDMSTRMSETFTKGISSRMASMTSTGGMGAMESLKSGASWVGSQFGEGGMLSGVGSAFGEGGMLSGVGAAFGEGGMLSGIGSLFGGGDAEGGFMSAIGSLFGGGAGAEGNGKSAKTPWFVQMVSTEQDPATALGGLLDNQTSDMENIWTNVETMFGDVTKDMGSTFGDLGGSLMSMLSGSGGGGGMAGWAGLAAQVIGAFDTGGVVPGARGAAQLAVVHSGETILPTHKRSIDEFGLPTVASGGSSTVVNLSVTGDISRQTRSAIFEMLPQITSGVNQNNKQANYRR